MQFLLIRADVPVRERFLVFPVQGHSSSTRSAGVTKRPR
ncbi:Hypothetical protein AA314_06615 [Archangium gephyra]|uniref:Uncharacterized protein n=1 Tax=Archangium gephyra TaxID=48 RepID=A0AAC8QCP0_9BACT|nr:Hypothetical protein AA314_06615 [Archangium gephyra]